MDAEQGTTLIWGVVMIVVLVASLAARRLPIGQTVRMALAWVAVFAGLYAILLFRDDFGGLWQRAKADLVGAEATISGSTTIIRRSGDGHFWVTADVGGTPVRFLIDSGATTTAISPETAAALRLDYSTDDRPVVVMTANGMMNSWPAELPAMRVGNVITPSLDVLVSGVAGSENLLGMNWLSSLSSWRVEGRDMVLEP